MTRAERARDLFFEGCNCAQAVFLAFAEDRMDRDTALKIASGNQYKSMLKRALHYIDQNYTDENLSLNAVAKAANISPNYFSGVFSQEMGQTFVEYLTEKRMARAKELLRYSGKRSSEVAYEVGYRDPRYFSFLFKKTQGCTPSSYRAGNGDGHEAK